MDPRNNSPTSYLVRTNLQLVYFSWRFKDQAADTKKTDRRTKEKRKKSTESEKRKKK